MKEREGLREGDRQSLQEVPPIRGRRGRAGSMESRGSTVNHLPGECEKHKCGTSLEAARAQAGRPVGKWSQCEATE